MSPISQNSHRHAQQLAGADPLPPADAKAARVFSQLEAREFPEPAQPMKKRQVVKEGDEKKVYNELLPIVQKCQTERLDSLYQSPPIHTLRHEHWKTLCLKAAQSAGEFVDGIPFAQKLLENPAFSKETTLAYLLIGSVQEDDDILVSRLAREKECTPRLLFSVFSEVNGGAIHGFIDRFGEKIFLGLLEDESINLLEEHLEKFQEESGEETIFESMLFAVEQFPEKALWAYKVFYNDSPLSDSQFGDLLTTLALNYTHRHKPFARHLLNILKTDRPEFDQPWINKILQIMALPAKRERKEFYIDLFNSCVATNNLPSPFAWSQAILKCARREDDQMVNTLWRMTNGARLSLVQFPFIWRNIMFNQYRSGSVHRTAYLELLPFFYLYSPETDALACEEEELKYVPFDKDQRWHEAVQTALSENRLILHQLTDPKITHSVKLSVLMEAFDLLLEAKAYAFAVAALLKNHLSDMPLDDLNRLFVQVQTNYHPELRNLLSRLRLCITEKESEIA